MGGPENGMYIVQGEVNLVVTAMRRVSRWSSHSHHTAEQDPLLSSFSSLKHTLNRITSLQELSPNEFLGPFLEVIRSEDTTGPITGLALTSINKFLSYSLIDVHSDTTAAAIENIADAVTHARFVGTDPASDEVVLMKILHVLRTLMLTPAGTMLTNESVCEIMQSCFRICFEMRLSELLRKAAEHTLMDMVQLLFTRLPQFKEDPKWATSLKKLKMRTGGMDPSRKFKKKPTKSKHKKPAQPHHTPVIVEDESSTTKPEAIDAAADASNVGHDASSVAIDMADAALDTSVTADNTSSAGLDTSSTSVDTSNVTAERPDVLPIYEGEMPVIDPAAIGTTPVSPSRTVVDMQEGFQHAVSEPELQAAPEETEEQPETIDNIQILHKHTASVDSGLDSVSTLTVTQADSEKTGSVSDVECESTHSAAEQSDSNPSHTEAEFVGPRGVRFMPPHHQHGTDGPGPLIPYGLPCVRELFRFLISLTNPHDRHNTDVMIHMGLSLLTVALESGADHIHAYNSLLSLVKDDMCKHLFFLLSSERLSLFAASIRVCYLLFEAMRSHLKFQLEMYLVRLMELVVSDSQKISYEQREISLESVVQLLRVPGLVTELYLNYDCDLYCTNLFEDLMKLLSKNAFPMSDLYSTHLLSLEALLAVIDSIEQHCHHRILHTSARLAAQTAAQKLQDENEEPSDTNVPPSSGYTVAEKLASTNTETDKKEAAIKPNTGTRGPRIRPNRMKLSEYIPNEEELAAIKHKKKIYQTGTEQFNVKPGKGIAYLQEHGLFATPLDPGEVVTFLRENPKLEKKQIGEYIGARKNEKCLEAFQKSFNYEDTRVDEALRMFLETFRLPGEAPVIQYILEHFAEHWHKMNGEPFANADAAFTFAYAVIMLNVDQHNLNAKKQNVPMTMHEFKKNLKKVNGGDDFDQDMLEETFAAIKNEEIVMPAEQTGLVKENYLWKVLLRRGSSKEGAFIHVPTGAFDRDLFSLVWGPTVAALSFVFDKSSEDGIVQKAISGFRKCAMISAHYGMSDVFDNLVISLCKFTTLLSSQEIERLPIIFGNNAKAKMAAHTVFGLAHHHGDILREGWKNILDCMLQLYKAKLLPEVFVTVEDFLDPSGKISLVREEKENQRSESGLVSGFFSYFAMTESPQQRGPTPEEQEAIKQAKRCIDECHVHQLVQESKFLRMDSLHELIKSLIVASQCPDGDDPIEGTTCTEDSAVFFLELLIEVVLQNRDRISPLWQSVRDHIYNLVVNAVESTFLVERAVVGLLRIAKRLLRRDEIAPQVLSSLHILLMMKPKVIHSLSRQIAYGLHDLLKTNAANIHSSQDWFTLFTLLEVVGAGTSPPPIMQVNNDINISETLSDAGAQSDSEITAPAPADTHGERGYTSDSELYGSQNKVSADDTLTTDKPPTRHGSWLMVNREDIENTKKQQAANQYNIVLNEEFKHHDVKSLTKCCETLAFLVRDAAHVTPHNFESCVHCLRTFVEASVNGGHFLKAQNNHNQPPTKRKSKKRGSKDSDMKKSRSSPSSLRNMVPDSDDENETDNGHNVSIQLLDLMHTLHTRAATIFSSWAEEEEGSPPQPLPAAPREEATSGEQTGEKTEGIDAGTSTLWIKCWCPLLQGIARLCCDSRRNVRSQALTYLQRALLVHDLQTLSAVEWENCFNKVLFPLLHKLLDTINAQDPCGIEETRMRGSTLLCKVFLQHLTPLLSLSTFTALWLTILEFMDKYMHADSSDLLCEAIPESLKNMLLVMHTAGILSSGGEDESQLWRLTWDRIDSFLPLLKEEVFKPHEQAGARNEPARSTISRDAEPPPPDVIPPNTEEQSPPTYNHTQVSNSTTPPDVVSQSADSTLPPGDGTNTQQGTAPPPQPPQGASPSHLPQGVPPPQIPQGASPQQYPQGVPPSQIPQGVAPPPFILHPPLPQVSSSGSTGGSVPLLLNPSLMQGTTIPIITPQDITSDEEQDIDNQHPPAGDQPVEIVTQ